MGAARSFAARLLRAMLWLAPAESRAWAEAMLRELDFVGLESRWGEWAALFWAMGCATAIFVECLRGWAAGLAKQLGTLPGIRQIQEENKMNSTGKKTLGVLSGIGLAVAFGVGAFFASDTIANLLTSIGIPRSMWSHLLTILLPTEIILVIVAVLLWKRRQAPIAVGILLTGFVMAAHIVVHFVTR